MKTEQENKLTAIRECLDRLNALRKQEESILTKLDTVLRCKSIEITEDEITQIFHAPLAICENCVHWDKSLCDVLLYGCNFCERS